ncbi:hypothetical protein [Agarivorans litoreus]|nr:hypothetical protein [Agarivorans litoreus]
MKSAYNKNILLVAAKSAARDNLHGAAAPVAPNVKRYVSSE